MKTEYGENEIYHTVAGWMPNKSVQSRFKGCFVIFFIIPFILTKRIFENQFFLPPSFSLKNSVLSNFLIYLTSNYVFSFLFLRKFLRFLVHRLDYYATNVDANARISKLFDILLRAYACVEGVHSLFLCLRLRHKCEPPLKLKSILQLKFLKKK